MNAPALRFGLAALATWRVTHLVAEEDGPADLVLRFRERLGDSLAGELMDCFACTSAWVAAPLVPAAVGRAPAADRLVALLALSGAACLLERIGHDTSRTTHDQEAPDGLLWEGARRRAHPEPEGAGGSSADGCIGGSGRRPADADAGRGHPADTHRGEGPTGGVATEPVATAHDRSVAGRPGRSGAPTGSAAMTGEG